MDLEVVGRHALLFDDDAMAAFVNSAAALVDWNSLSIDRYDVRHLLSDPPPPRSRRRHRYSPSSHQDDASLESELDHERYLDLPSPSEEQDLENEAEQENPNPSGYHAIAFSYGAPNESSEEKNTEAESGFQPPFSLPEHLLQNLPPSEKVHQIIARTALFVSKHGGQSEIVLRVKQGDNPTFGFLLPDHNLHPYFRFLVDHKELLKSDFEGKSIEEENKGDSDQMGDMGGALSLLGSVYGSGEDEDAATEDAPTLTKNVSEAAVNADDVTISHGSQQNNLLNVADKFEALSKPSFPSLKERSHVIKRNRSISVVKSGPTTGVKKDSESAGAVSSTVDKLQPSDSSGVSKIEPPILEPPSDLKRVVDKIVEFIMRNGKEFEAVLVQQDIKHGRFPFLLPSNQFHTYYLKVLQKAQESRLAGKSFILEKHDSVGHGMDKKTGSKENDTLSLGSDIPYEPDRKEKFKMVIGKSKKDGQDPPSKANMQQVGVCVDAAAAAAILQAATKGNKKPNLEILSKTLSGIGQPPSSDGGDSHLSSRDQSSNNQKLDQHEKTGVVVPVAKTVAKTAANEADSTEAREQKIKAERLKRAKMFAAMLKSGSAPLKNEPLRGLSVEPSESGFSVSDSQVVCLADQERESNSVPLDVDSNDKIEKTEKKGSTEEHNERRQKRSYRSRSTRAEEDEEEEEEEELKQKRDHKHSRKKRHRSSHRSGDRHKHRKRRTSLDRGSQHQHENISTLEDENKQDGTSECENGHSRHSHKRGSSSDDEHGHSRHRKKHDGSSDSGHKHSRHNYKHGSSSNDEHGHSRHRQKHDSSSDGGHKHSRRRHKHDSSSDDDRVHSRHGHKHDSSSEDGRRHSRWRHRHDSSDDDEHRHPRRWTKCYSSFEDGHIHSRRSRGKHSEQQHKHESSSDEEQRYRAKSVKHRKTSRSEREADLEEGEILIRSDQSKASEGGDGASREASVDLSKSHREVRPPSQPAETAEVSDDLRAKIRAMLLATL